MYSRRYPDIIQQQIEGMALVMAHILGIKAEGNFAIAQTAVAREFEKTSGLNVKLALALPISATAIYFPTSNEVDVARTFASAMFLEEYARLALCQNLIGSARAAFRLSLALYRAALNAEESLRTPENNAKLLRIVAELEDESPAAIA